MLDPIAIEHSEQFKDKFAVVAIKNSKVTANFVTRPYRIILRDDLSIDKATEVSQEIRKLLKD